ncbi:MAG: hypothetical protein NTW14_03255 [bacterium]|nr:hypothetical protein [bacterium]
MKNAKMIGIILLAFLFLGLLSGCAGSQKGKSQMQARAQRVQAALTDLVSALQTYKDEKGYFPKGLAILRDGHYFSLMPDLEKEWTFNYYPDGGQIMMVDAVSRAEMSDGAGHKIVYRPRDQVWEGYGITDFNKKVKK